MPILDISTLLSEVSVHQPCGPDLEYSPEYIETARLMDGTPDVQYGDMHLAAVEPDWRAVKTLSSALFARSHDLRLAVWLTRAMVALHGFEGLDEGLAIVQRLLDRYWDCLHPQLDVEDDNDPMARINTLAALDDPTGLVRQAHAACLVDSPAHGHFSLRDIDVVKGELGPAADSEPPDTASADAAFSSVPYEAMDATARTLARSIDRLVDIDALVTQRAGYRRVVGLQVLPKLLQRAHVVLQDKLARHPGRAMTTELENAAGQARDTLGAARPVDCRSDVVHTLDRLCQYYALQEPSSPVPLLLQRARRLVDMSFIEILGDLSPGAVGEIKHVAGIEPSRAESS